MVLRSLLIDSANDAAYALAEKVAGSLARFGPIMTTAASEMGMRDHPVLHDPAGLDGTEGVDGGNLMSAWDVAIAARDVLSDPALRPIVAMRTYTFKGPDGIVYELYSKNAYFLETYPGAIGVKTGFTDPAGLCIAAASTRGGRTLLAVVMHGVSTYQTAEDLLNRGFAMPAAAEPASDPVLPAVHEPGPDPGPPAARTHARPPAQPGPRTDAAATPTSRHALPDWIRRPNALDWIDLGVVVMALALVIRQVRRRRPAGAHSRSGCS